MQNILPWFDFLDEQIPDHLPGEKVHLEMLPLRQLSSEALKSAKNYRQSAVAIHVFEQANKLWIVLTRRSTYNGTHSGQVSFPGGKMDASDENLITTARRESFEEINLAFNAGQLIGKMTDVFIPVSNFHVSPYVFYHDQPPKNLRADPREVESIFYLPADILVDDQLVQKRDIVLSPEYSLTDIPCFMYNNFMIWGATALLLNELKHVLKQNFK